MKRNRKAKILATLGPSSSTSDLIKNLFLEGCDVFRLNFSHGDIESHRNNLEIIRKLEDEYNHSTCVLADLQGPKLRLGLFKNDEENLIKGQNFQLDLNNELGNSKRVNFPHPEIYDNLTPNTIISSLKENFNFTPSTPYAVSRAACDLHLNSFFKAYNFPVVFTRAANVYGPGQQLYRIIPRTILSMLTGRKMNLHGGGLSKRSFIHIFY